MNIQEYISSGIIESYVMGQLSEKECAEVIAMANKYPEVKAEIEAVENALIDYTSKTPRAELKKKILNSLDVAPSAKIIPITKKNNSFTFWIAAASVALLIASLFYNISLRKELDSMHSEMADLSSEKEKYAHDYENQSAAYQQIIKEMAVVMQPENKKIMLKGMGAAPDALAAVYWNPAKGDVYINVSSLPAPADDKQYQLWAIVDGKPVDAGMLEMDSTFIHKMKSVENAQAFAVTLEKKGGSPVPTMTAMYLMGNV